MTKRLAIVFSAVGAVLLIGSGIAAMLLEDLFRKLDGR